MADGEVQAQAKFTAMTEGTQDDWMAIMKAAGPFNRTLPDRLIGRLDAKAFRDTATLKVRGFWPEAGIRLGTGRRARLEAELDRLARFAGCDRVEYLPGWERAAA